MQLELGIIEGFYGRPWSWEARRKTVTTLSPFGYRFYLYAPKADVYLRRRWAESHPPDTTAHLRELARHCEAAGVRFGIGLSPFEIFQRFDESVRSALGNKLSILDGMEIRDLAILFDDMRGDLPDLAARQIEIVEWIASRTSADRIIVCPSYYSDDPVLDRVFGRRPEGYLSGLGEGLASDIAIMWTGEEVCSRELSVAHLQRVTQELRRKPFLWDNYPVNDGQRMSQYLHLRAFTGRSAHIAEHITAHGVNPALQPTLSLIPAITLADRYRQGESAYAYGAAFQRAASEVLGEKLAELLREDVLTLQDIGLDRLGEKEAALRSRYSPIDHDAAREIIGWLDGEYRITDEIVQTQ